eukprot:PhF_6_TR4533/c0_g1_i2/m.6366/K11068/hlyIII; hemolysin III
MSKRKDHSPSGVSGQSAVVAATNTLNNPKPITIHQAESFYLLCCQHLKTTPDPTVLATIKTGSSVIRPYSPYSESHWFVLVQLLLLPFSSHPLSHPFIRSGWSDEESAALDRILKDGGDGTPYMVPVTKLWFRWRAVVGFNEAVLLRRLLEVNTYITELVLDRNKINAEAATALAQALRKNTTLKVLNLHGNHMYHEGACALAAALRDAKQKTALVSLDVSNDHIGYEGVQQLNNAVSDINTYRAAQKPSGEVLNCNTDMNYVMEEIANGITHGIGLIFAIVGFILMVNAASDKSWTHVISAVVYGLTLILTFMASCLCHSLFKLVRTAAVFQRLDHASIFLLIAGTYTPILNINLAEWFWSPYLLWCLWFATVVGLALVSVACGKYPKVQLSMYLAMGWAAVVCFPKFIEVLPYDMLYLIVVGGLFYTVGVIFFVLGNDIPVYHVVWHVFVMIAAF